MRIVFANQFYEVCKAAGADYTTIKNAAVKRHDIVDHYLECNKEFRAFGGSCLGFNQSLFQFICWYNDKIRHDEPPPMTREEWLWAKNTCRSGKQNSESFWGKPGTSDRKPYA